MTVMHYLLFIINFIKWWYTKGLIRLFEYEAVFIAYLANIFSIKESLLHLFSPWKKLVEARRAGLEGFRDWIIDNLVSRSVGFVMRLFLIIFFLVSLTVSLAGCIVLIIVWIGWPVIVFWGLSWGISNA